MSTDTGCIMDSTWQEPCGEPTVSEVPGEPGYLWCKDHLPLGGDHPVTEEEQ